MACEESRLALQIASIDESIHNETLDEEMLNSILEVHDIMIAILKLYSFM